MTRLLPNLIHRRRPVGWWRCEYSSDPDFKSGEIYPCIQAGMSRDPGGTLISAKEREFRLFSELDEYAHAPRYLGYPHHLFECHRYQVKFNFVRRMEKREYAEILEQVRPGLTEKLELDEYRANATREELPANSKKRSIRTGRNAAAACLAGVALVGLFIGLT